MTAIQVFNLLGYTSAFGIALFLERRNSEVTNIKDVIIALMLSLLGWWMIWVIIVIFIEEALSHEHGFLYRKLW